MENLEFVKKVIELYEDNATVDPLNHPKVKRGRGRTVASQTEDLFGIYVSELLGDSYEVLIDTRIDAIGKNGVKIAEFYPDIAICKDGTVLQMWDLKMDTGWIRGKLWDILDKNRELVDRIRGAVVKEGTKHLESGYTISGYITYNIAIITLCNGGKAIDKVYKYANGEIVDGRNMNEESSKVFYLFKHRDVRKSDPDFRHDDYHPNWGFNYQNGDVWLEYDLEQKLSCGKFDELRQFIGQLSDPRSL